MHCKACNKLMDPNEIRFNAELKDFEVCGTCLSIVRDVLETHEADDERKRKQRANRGTPTVSTV